MALEKITPIDRVAYVLRLCENTRIWSYRERNNLSKNFSKLIFGQIKAAFMREFISKKKSHSMNEEIHARVHPTGCQREERPPAVSRLCDLEYWRRNLHRLLCCTRCCRWCAFFRGWGGGVNTFSVLEYYTVPCVAAVCYTVDTSGTLIISICLTYAVTLISYYIKYQNC